MGKGVWGGGSAGIEEGRRGDVRELGTSVRKAADRAVAGPIRHSHDTLMWHVADASPMCGNSLVGE